MAQYGNIEHDPARGLFELVLDGQTAHIQYRREGDVLAVLHTIVPEAIGGRGIAGALTEALVAYVRDAGLRIDPRCAYTEAWFRRHPEAADLLA